MNIIPMNESQDSSEDEERVFTKIRRRANRIQEDYPDGPDSEEITVEMRIKGILDKIDTASEDDIEKVMTASNLCRCRNPVTISFEISTKLRELSNYRDESKVFLTTLAEKVEDFSVALMDQISRKEQELLQENGNRDMDNYASLLDRITESAIRFEQKKFVSHPLVYKLLNQRWNYGLPCHFLPGKTLRFLVYVFTILDTIFTPVFLPLITYVFYKDQVANMQEKRNRYTDQVANVGEKRKRKEKTLRDMYLDYITTPFIIFLKDKLQQLVFMALHVRICILGSSVSPRIEEYLVLVFYIGLLISEVQQYCTSKSRAYLRNMWNYVDVITLSCHSLIFVLRVATIIKGGDPYHNRLLEVVNFLYGVNALLLVLRFSSILELNKTAGPLQLALFKMIVDLITILVQFAFVIVAFSVAITMVYTAEMSYLTPTRELESNWTQVKSFCLSGSLYCLFNTSTHLVWSVFGLTNLETMVSHDNWSRVIVDVLYVMFLILSVIMLINMLIALLTNTYNKVETNADVEWKFSRAVVADEYRRYHPIVVPFNIITYPVAHCYIKIHGDARAERAKDRQRDHQEFIDEDLFPEITKRYLDKHGESFPISIEAKVDLLQKNMQKILQFLKPDGDERDAKLGGEVQHRDQTSAQNSRNLQEAGTSCDTTV